MNTKILDFVKFKSNATYAPATDTTITILAESPVYDLEMQRQTGELSDFRLLITEKTDPTKYLRIAIEDIDSSTTVSGKTQYVLNIKLSDASNLMVGLANDDDGTNSDSNIISENLSSLGLTNFSKESPVKLVVGSAEYNLLLTALTALTTTEPATAGEAIDSTSGNLGVSIHTDGKYYKYHKTNYPNYQGVILSGQTIAVDGTFTLYNLKAITTGFTGLGNSLVYVDNGGTFTATQSATTEYAGIARNGTVLVGAERAPTASELTEAEAIDPDSTVFGTVSGDLLAKASPSVELSHLQVSPIGESVNSSTERYSGSDVSHYYNFHNFGKIGINKLVFQISAVSVAGSFKCAVYTSDGSSKLWEETIAVTTTGIKEVSFPAEIDLESGEYIFGFVNVGTTDITFHTNGFSLLQGTTKVGGKLTGSAGNLPSTVDMSAVTSQSEFPYFRFDN